MHNPEGSGLGPGIFTDEQMDASRKKETAEAVRRIEEREREKERAREATLQAEHEEGQKEIEHERERLRREWVASGGSAGEFDSNWRTIRQGILLERSLSKEEEREERAASVRDIWRSA